MSSVESESVVEPPRKRGRPKREIVTAPAPAPPAEQSDTGAIIDAITRASRDPTVDIGKMQFLLDTRRKLMAEEAEHEWRDAMARVQAELGPINRDLENPSTRSKYSSLAALDTAVRPHYTEHGFLITFDTEPHPEPSSILVVCYVERGGHSRRYSIPMPCDGVGPQGRAVMSRTHAVGSAVSYGRRYLLCCALNLVTADDDGNRASAPGVTRTGARFGGGGFGAPKPPPDIAAPPPPDMDERARHTREAIAAATTHARSGLMKALENGVEAVTAKQRAEQIKELREVIAKAKITEATVCEVFSVESLDDMTGEEIAAAIKKANKNLEGRS